MGTFADYLVALKTNYTPAVRLQWLHPDDSVAFEITDKLITGGTLNVTSGTGQRRTATITLDNWANTYDINVNKIWFGQKVALSMGVYLADGTPFYLPQGVFYISDPTVLHNPNERTTSIPLVDKWGFLDGTVGGNMEGIYALNPNDNLLIAIEQLLSISRGNGLPLDNVAPLFSSKLITQTITLSDNTVVPITNCPYSYRSSDTGTYADVLSEIATMLVAEIGYDAVGRLCVDSIQTDISSAPRSIAWHYSPKDVNFLGQSNTARMSKLYNDVIISGATLNGDIATGRATDTSASSPTSVARIGYKSYRKSESKYYADSQCQMLAEYYLDQYRIMQYEVSVRCAPIYHLNAKDFLAIVMPSRGDIAETYMVNNFSLPIAQLGEMTCNITNITDLRGGA